MSFVLTFFPVSASFRLSFLESCSNNKTKANIKLSVAVVPSPVLVIVHVLGVLGALAGVVGARLLAEGPGVDAGEVASSGSLELLDVVNGVAVRAQQSIHLLRGHFEQLKGPTGVLGHLVIRREQRGICQAAGVKLPSVPHLGLEAVVLEWR